MKGFEERWRDFPDYIIGITYDIWEEKRVDRLRDWYADDIIFRMASGAGTGCESVMRGTLETLNVFPDRRLLTEDVVWSGNPAEGMLSSHRILAIGTHKGNGVFGPPTGKTVSFRVIADCHARNNRIDDEWLARDQGAICHQLGWEPREFARNQIALEGGYDRASRPFTPDQDRKGPYSGNGNESEWGASLADTIVRIMNSEISAIRKDYDRGCFVACPGGIEGRSWEPAEEFWTGLRTSFPSAVFSIEHRMGIEELPQGARAAVRWSLNGKHDGWGAFGPPTGAEVYIMGFTHAEYGPRGIRAEFTVFDETAVWKQILLHSGQCE